MTILKALSGRRPTKAAGSRARPLAAVVACAVVGVLPMASPGTAGAAPAPATGVVVAAGAPGEGGTLDAWHIGGIPVQRAGVQSVSTAGGAAFSVGFGFAGTGRDLVFQPLAARWNGQAWTVDEVPLPPGAEDARLDGVVALNARDAWAVGSWQGGGQEHQLITHWDGTAWRTSDAATVPGGLNAVAATGPNDVWATGFSQNEDGSTKAAVRHWDGRAWTDMDLKADTGDAPWSRYWVSSISAVSPNDVWLVGVGNLAVHYDGRTWTRTPISPDRNAWFEHVRTSPVFGTWAVGFYTALGTPREPAAFRWDGTAWQRMPLPQDSGAQLEDVAFTATGPVGVGYSMDPQYGPHAYGLTLPAWPGDTPRHLEMPHGASQLNAAAAGPGGIGLWIVGDAPNDYETPAPFTAWALVPPRSS
ncbi:hypothetical protein [Yinghuangia seranimata]|uniref:hypothetical protein n=1 Tax=Yinghuangia seranimata TaxID=408067 RepID=UPI00248B77E2|nr:hypothetical protein [Yinghuangia seranimata]MDI2128252.1 hypothetical protein [Yinghuangia seranimata]